MESLREKISNELNITKKEIFIDPSSTAYPTMIFRFLMDSKADIDLKAKELVAYVYMGGVLFGKITWNRMEETLKVNSVPDIESKGSGWFTIHFTPPFSAFKSETINWALNGIMVFSTESDLGDVTKHIAVNFIAKKEEIKRVLEQYPKLA